MGRGQEKGGAGAEDKGSAPLVGPGSLRVERTHDRADRRCQEEQPQGGRPCDAHRVVPEDSPEGRVSKMKARGEGPIDLLKPDDRLTETHLPRGEHHLEAVRVLEVLGPLLSIGRQWLGGEAGDWYAAGNYDCKTLSKYPILHQEALSGNLVVLLDTTDVLGTTLLVINAHTPCCGNDDGRQWEIDEMNWFIGRVRADLHPSIPADTAVQIVGDLNLVGFRQQLESLVTGDIVYESDWGGDVAPDVDGSSLLDTRPLHSGDRTSYTWRNDFSSFWPGRLDVSII